MHGMMPSCDAVKFAAIELCQKPKNLAPGSTEMTLSQSNSTVQYCTEEQSPRYYTGNRDLEFPGRGELTTLTQLLGKTLNFFICHIDA